MQIFTFTQISIQIIRPSYNEPLEVEAVATFDPSHDVKEVRCEDERYALPVHTKEVLPVTQDVAKVNVKQVPWEPPGNKREIKFILSIRVNNDIFLH